MGDNGKQEMEKIFGPSAEAKLIKLSLCPCGFPLLRDEITLGTVYTVYPKSEQEEGDWALSCGGCGSVITGKGKIYAGSVQNPTAPVSWLPREIFEIEERG